MDPWLESFARANFLRSTDTAHDLKTPLNVAVLNLELLRMRIRKVCGEEDEKIAGYTRSIEIELRRMASIFDAFFLLSAPPKNEGEPVSVDLCPICTELGANSGFQIVTNGKRLLTRTHESRIRQGLKMFFEGASRVLHPEGRFADVSGDTRFSVTITGRPADEEFEPAKLFKFYYSDPQGNPDIALATARLIAETYGGELNAARESDKVSLRMSLPLGAE